MLEGIDTLILEQHSLCIYWVNNNSRTNLNRVECNECNKKKRTLFSISETVYCTTLHLCKACLPSIMHDLLILRILPDINTTRGEKQTKILEIGPSVRNTCDICEYVFRSSNGHRNPHTLDKNITAITHKDIVSSFDLCPTHVGLFIKTINDALSQEGIKWKE